MRFRLVAFALLVAAAASAATPPKTPVKSTSKTPSKATVQTIAPPTIAHPMAMFLGGLSKDGKEKVTFRATAFGTHFFLEEPSGVTVYVYDETVGYRRETFLKGSTLANALKKYQ